MTPIILVVADGSPAGGGALRLAGRLAEREGARIEVLAVHDPAALRIVRGNDPTRSIRPPAADAAVRELRERIRSQLQEIGAEEWPLTVQVGGVARMIASYAVDCGAARVLLGLNEADPAERWLAREMLLDLIPRLGITAIFGTLSFPAYLAARAVQAGLRRTLRGWERIDDWVEDNRKYVEEQSDGKVGYIHVPNTGVQGQNELFRQFYGQIGKDALITDPAVAQLRVASSLYWTSIIEGLYLEDAWQGLIKPFFLGFVIVTILYSTTKGVRLALRTLAQGAIEPRGIGGAETLLAPPVEDGHPRLGHCQPFSAAGELSRWCRRSSPAWPTTSSSVGMSGS